MAACDDGPPLQPITAIPAIVVRVDTDEAEPMPVVMPEEETVMRADPGEMSMAAMMPGFGGPGRRHAQNGGSDRAETDTSPIHIILHDFSLVTRPALNHPAWCKGLQQTLVASHWIEVQRG
jgi:hypothetical protein